MYKLTHTKFEENSCRYVSSYLDSRKYHTFLNVSGSQQESVFHHRTLFPCSVHTFSLTSSFYAFFCILRHIYLSLAAIFTFWFYTFAKRTCWQAVFSVCAVFKALFYGSFIHGVIFSFVVWIFIVLVAALLMQLS